jgi:glycosyltransferase involved in cell wall biosynthesis
MIRHVVHLVASVPDWDHIVLCPERRVGGGTDTVARAELAAAGARVVTVPMVRSATSPANLRATATAIRALRTLRPAVLHGHSSIGGVVARLAGSALRIPVVYTPNAVLPSRASLAIERILARRTDITVAVSPTEQRQLTELRLVPRHGLVVVPNAIPLDDPPPLDLRAELGLPAGTPLFGSICRLVPQKAPEVLVRAWLLALDGPGAPPDAHAVLIGDGPLAPEVDALLAGHPRVHRIPYLERAERALGSLDLFTLASRYEGAPYVLLEAMRAGAPVVATDVVGTHDTLADGTGVLVPVEDAPALATAIRDTLADTALRATLSERAGTRFRERFDVAVTGRQMSELYARVAARRW